MSEVWATALAISPSWGAPIDFNDIPELADCVTLIEPGLFSFNNDVYLASSCLIADPFHQGCVVYTFDDFAAGSLVRDASGAPQ